MAGLTESWMADKAKDGVRMAGEGNEFAVGVLPEVEDDYMILYDTLDGHPLRIPWLIGHTCWRKPEQLYRESVSVGYGLQALRA